MSDPTTTGDPGQELTASAEALRRLTTDPAGNAAQICVELSSLLAAARRITGTTWQALNDVNAPIMVRVQLTHADAAMRESAAGLAEAAGRLNRPPQH